MKLESDHRSKFSNLSNWKEEAWKKKSGLQRDSNPWPPRYQCDALPTELWSHTLGGRSIYWVHIFPCSEMMWSLYENDHISLSSTTAVQIWIISYKLHVMEVVILPAFENKQTNTMFNIETETVINMEFDTLITFWMTYLNSYRCVSVCDSLHSLRL